MRLWHYRLIRFLPKSQLLAQWRELNSIFKKQDKHILINYIYDFPKTDLMYYARLVMQEMGDRGIKIKSFDNFQTYFADVPLEDNLKADPEDSPEFIPFEGIHDFFYLRECYYNLEEKFFRGQKDFGGERMYLLARLFEAEEAAFDEKKVKIQAWDAIKHHFDVDSGGVFICLPFNFTEFETKAVKKALEYKNEESI